MLRKPGSMKHVPRPRIFRTSERMLPTRNGTRLALDLHGAPTFAPPAFISSATCCPASTLRLANITRAPAGRRHAVHYAGIRRTNMEPAQSNCEPGQFVQPDMRATGLACTDLRSPVRVRSQRRCHCSMPQQTSGLRHRIEDLMLLVRSAAVKRTRNGLGQEREACQGYVTCFRR
jgi:hypothetical protein